MHRSEYQQLTQQIEPHFLFNALNSLLTLARLNRTSELIPMFENLVRFLRFTYQEKGQLHTVEKELSHTSNYLSIQKIRIGSRLNVYLDAEQLLNRALIPPYLLQTIVENAFKHGIEQIEGQAELKISLKMLINEGKEYIDLKVIDNGPGFTFDPIGEVKIAPLNQQQYGIGLENLNKRLELLFSRNYLIEIDVVNEMHTGGSIRVVWPLLTSESLNQGDENVEYPVTG
ncbi:histidine kinase [Tepidibacillus marianensis]|uniref:sensor histidine kinase n=1 Tax=Tepidibacillus marianensis TaxID=3131995 RepID=UPI0030D52E17